MSQLDGVYNDFSDQTGFDAECNQGADIGMDGKTLIHPAQICAANTAFSPSEDEIAWSEKVVAAFDLPENAEANVVNPGGNMVERLHAEMAGKLLLSARAIESRG